jgi:NADPH-dependent curcumin reductase CurA
VNVTNRRIFLRERPTDMPTAEHFGVEEVPIEDVPDDHVLVKVDTLSIDAFIRTTLNADGFHASTPVGGTITALGVGEVVASKFDGLKPGDWVNGPLLAQTYALMPGAMFQKIEPAANIPPSTYLGVLGLTTGLTAWAGMVAVGNVSDTDTVVVSGAAGAVGTVAVQLAKARGARVIGIAGGPEKCRFLTEELGLDGAIDYKHDDIDAKVKQLAPDGINLFFDNVGGEILDIMLDNLAMNGRIVLCGAISQYQNMGEVQGPKLYLRIAERNAAMLGFTVDHYADRFEEAAAELGRLLTEGKMNLPEHVISGIDNFPTALTTMFTGGHTGKLLVKP